MTQQTNDLDLDGFQLDESAEEALLAKHNEFIDQQEEVEVVNGCDSGACAI